MIVTITPKFYCCLLAFLLAGGSQVANSHADENMPPQHEQAATHPATLTDNEESQPFWRPLQSRSSWGPEKASFRCQAHQSPRRQLSSNYWFFLPRLNSIPSAIPSPWSPNLSIQTASPRTFPIKSICKSTIPRSSIGVNVRCNLAVMVKRRSRCP